MSETPDFEALRNELLGSYLLFVRTFFPLMTGREFIMSEPVGRESHFLTVSRTLTSISRLELLDTVINIPPGHAKSTMLSMWVAWNMARYPDANYLYISYSQTLAAKHTEFIKRIMTSVDYERLFGTHIRKDSRAKDFFQTEDGGAVAAFGAQGAITGRDAGLPGLNRHSGAVIIDDPHKPDEVHSDVLREKVIDNYKETIVQRKRGINVPIVVIAQRLHEADLCDYLLSEESEYKFNHVCIKALDEADNAIYPEINPKEMLIEKRNKSPYVFAGQFQQNPVPAGGALFKEKDFILLDEEPEVLVTFITADTAETAKTHNDASAFAFWGVYKIKQGEFDTGLLGLHCLDAQEVWVEPKHLKDTFLDFYTECMRHHVKPTLAAIEKKSTGVTLLSVLEDVRGLQVRDIQRTKASGSKADRYLEMQPVIASKRVTFTQGARHAKMYIEHMTKITANDTHRRDDLADCMYDGCKIALLDELLYREETKREDTARTIADKMKQQQLIRASYYHG